LSSRGERFFAPTAKLYDAPGGSNFGDSPHACTSRRTPCDHQPNAQGYYVTTIQQVHLMPTAAVCQTVSLCVSGLEEKDEVNPSPCPLSTACLCMDVDGLLSGIIPPFFARSAGIVPASSANIIPGATPGHVLLCHNLTVSLLGLYRLVV